MKTLETLRIFSLSVLGPALALATMFSAGIVLADPPARIGRLSYFSGTVSFSPAGDDQWAYAVLNRPVITGDRLWSDNGGRVELTLDNGAFWLGDATSIVVSNIDDRTAQFELQQGTLDFRIRRLPPGDVVEIDTPNLAFQVTRPGRYRIAVDPQSATTTVIVRNGNAEIYGEGASYVVATGQAYRFYGTDLRDSEYFTPRGVDDFERFVLERDSRFDRVMSVRYVSPEVVGYEDLDRYGSWRPVESYGNVWFPQQVPSGWAPYREGHWSWIDPWGWTWVDDAPWGFAPFHYGRWAYVEGRWGWVPGPVDVRPVYAPALVAFVGGANFGVSVSSGPAIGWFPLAPREVYRPAYNVSREYYRQVNVSNTVINNTVINNTYVSNVTTTTAPVAQQVNYVNLRAPNAVTAVPPTAFAQSQPVNRVAVRLPSAALDAAQVQSMAQIAPARTAFVGAAPPARATPPAAVQQQVVVAKSPPPPAPVPVAQKLPALEKNPGKPLDRAELQANRAPGPVTVPAQNARVVNPGKPTTTAPPPAVQGDALRARTAPPIAAPPVTTAPAAPQAGTATTPTPKSETRGQPPLVPAPPTPSASERQDRRIDTRGADTGQPPRSPEALRQGSPSPSAPTVPQPPPRAADQRPASVAPPGAAQPPAPRPPEPRAIPQEQPRPVPQAQPQAQPPAPRPPEPRAIPQEQPRPVPQPQPPTPQAAPPASRAIPQEQPRPVPQAQPPTPPAAPPAARAIPQEQSRPIPQAQPPTPPAAPPASRAIPQEQPRPVPQAQPQPQAQPVPAPPKPEPKPDNKRDDKKEKEKDKQG